MRQFGLPLFFFSLLVSVAITLACGLNSPRMLETVLVNPATADAQNFPNGQVPFLATGYYTKTPSPVSPEAATWGACGPEGVTTAVSVSTSGVAQCTAGASGTYFVFAEVPNPAFKGPCSEIQSVCGGSCSTVVGTALLTCP